MGKNGLQNPIQRRKAFQISIYFPLQQISCCPVLFILKIAPKIVDEINLSDNIQHNCSARDKAEQLVIKEYERMYLRKSNRRI